MRQSLALFSLVLIGCNPPMNTETNGPICEKVKVDLHGDFYPFALNRFILPMDNKQFAIDVNGDGKVDNQFGSLMATLAMQGIKVQEAADQAAAAGPSVSLLRVQALDLKTDSTVGLTWYAGKVAGDMFSVDDTVSPALFIGKLDGGRYKSSDPVRTKTPVSLTIALSFIPGEPPVRVPLHGAQAEFTAGSDPSSGVPMLVDGRLRGSIKASEVAQIPIFKAIFASDVQIYDDMGNYAPNAKNQKKDSMSFAIAFTAVQASFVAP